MTGSIHSVAASVPGYCTSGHGVLTSSQYAQCVKIGWNQSYSTPISADLAGHGSALGPVLFVLLIIAALFALGRRLGRTRSIATSK